MRVVKLLMPPLAVAGAAWAYKRFVAGPGEGVAETESAEPFSSDDMPAPEAAAPAAGQDGASGSAGGSDDLTHPTWLKPADS